MFEDGMECRHCAGGDALTTRRGAAAAARAGLCGLACGDIGLGALDLAEGERADLLRTKQRLDVRLDPAAVHSERRGLDWSPPPAEDPSRLGLSQKPVAQRGYGDSVGVRLGRGGGIAPLIDDAQNVPGSLPSLFRRHHPVAADHGAPMPALGSPVLHDEAP